MKKSLFSIILCFSATFHNVAFSEEIVISSEFQGEIENTLMRPFFNAMKNGNVEAIKRYITGEKYDEARMMLTDKDYPAFLRKYYKDAEFSVEKGVFSDDGVVVDIVIEFPEGGTQTTQFYLLDPNKGNENSGRSAGEKHWKITEQRNKRAR